MINNTEVDYNGHQPEDSMQKLKEKVKAKGFITILTIWLILFIFPKLTNRITLNCTSFTFGA
jgi:hypothetical protein